jgi:uridine kinase
MIGDNLTVKEHHLIPAHAIFNFISSSIDDHYTISIGGESGCGKSTLSVALRQVLEQHGYNAIIFHMDDYFHLPPASNHNNREKDLKNVGPHEVDLSLLQEHVNAFKNGQTVITKPLVYYAENEIRQEVIDFSGYKILIVEGTYTPLLKVDLKIFMERNYHDTHQNRIERARDPLTPFVESVLEIEHNIIKQFGASTQIMVDKNYDIKFCKQ